MCPHAQIREVRTIRCVLVHDSVLLRQGLRRLMEDEPDIKVVGEACNPTDALKRIFEHRPDVVIAEQDSFGCPTEQAVQLVLRESPGSKVLFLTASRDAEPAVTSDGATYAPLQTSVEELIEMLRTLAQKGFSPRSNGNLGQVHEFISRSRTLTAREHEVLKLLAEGRTVRSVATLLGLSIKTVDAHKFNLMRKLGIHNKAELVMWAIQRRVVKIPVNY